MNKKKCYCGVYNMNTHTSYINSIYIYIYVYIYTYTYTYVCMYVYMYMYEHMYYTFMYFLKKREQAIGTHSVHDLHSVVWIRMIVGLQRNHLLPESFPSGELGHKTPNPITP